IIIALALILPILAEFYRTGVVDRFPTLFMAGFIGLSGIVSLGCGMILDSIAAKERREFEYKLQQIEHNKKLLLNRK
ncbi:MAG: glycosyl transferase, partial [Oscillospiraceae bacterium]|nr:glycosyl transferase [Oscillospiraceae bacterium]